MFGNIFESSMDHDTFIEKRYTVGSLWTVGVSLTKTFNVIVLYLTVVGWESINIYETSLLVHQEGDIRVVQITVDGP